MEDPDAASPRPEMADPDPTPLQAAAMADPDHTSLQEAMEVPITASLGPMGPLLRKLHSIGPEQQHLPQDDIRLLKVLCVSLKNMSEDEHPSFMVQWWMRIVRELCYDTEDVLDEVVDGGHAQSDFSHLLTRVKDASKRRESFEWSPLKTMKASGFAEASVSRLSSSELPVPICGGRAKVGTGEPPKKLVELLAFDDDKKALKVIPIKGYAGVGKTTVATALYHKHGGKFQCRAFVSVSQKPDISGFLASMLSQLKAPRPRGFPDVPDLIDAIRRHLEGKRYFIVIDDLWTSSVWNLISRAFPRGDYCSRIITTTQIDDVALACCGYESIFIYIMEPLNDDESRKLFFGRVFGSEDLCPIEIKEVSYEIIRKCAGLPLAIVNMASLLARESNIAREEKLKHIQDCFTSSSPFDEKGRPTSIQLDKGTVAYKEPTGREAKGKSVPVPSLSAAKNDQGSSYEGMNDVLNLICSGLPHLIYNSLPPRLRTCLLYLSMYPQGYIIKKEELVKQWVAEGLLSAVEGRDIEEIAECYFDELISTGMVQAVDTNNDGEVLSCKVSQMVLDFIRHKSMEENFVVTVDCFQSTVALHDKVRRLSIQFGGVKSSYIPKNIKTPQVRSLIFWGFFKCVPSIMECGLLQVLVLHIWADQDKKSFDLTRIGELFRLKYLNIECNITVKLPGKIRRLRQLGTLQVDARLSAVPSDVVYLESLLHLRLPSEFIVPRIVAQLASIRTLGYFDISRHSVQNVLHLGRVSKLQDIQLTCSRLQPAKKLERNVQVLGSILHKLRALQSLSLVPASGFSGAPSIMIPYDGFSMVSPPSDLLLRRIELSRHCCIFFNLPRWFGKLGNLCILKIALKELSREDIDILKGLPSLTALTLYIQTAPEERFFIYSGGFEVLTYFKFLCAAPCLSFVQGAMPKVQKLSLGFNANNMESQTLEDAGLHHLTGLTEISVKFGAQSADEYDIKAAESALEAAFRNHPSKLLFRVQCEGKKVTALEKPQEDPDHNKKKTESLKGNNSMTTEMEHTETTGSSKHTSIAIKEEEDTALKERQEVEEVNEKKTESPKGESSVTEEKRVIALNEQQEVEEVREEKTGSSGMSTVTNEKKETAIKKEQGDQEAKKKKDQSSGAKKRVNKQLDSRYARKDRVFTPWTHHPQSFDLLTGAMAPLLPKLLELIKDEYNLKPKVKNNVESLHNELEAMQAALRDAAELEPVQLGGEARSWAKLVRNLSYDAEDVIDSLLVHIKGSRGSIKGLISWVTEFSRRRKAHHEIGNVIQSIKKQAHDVADLRMRYNVNGHIIANPAATSIKPPKSNLYTYPKELVGIKVSRDEVIRKLIDGTNDELKIVSIVGIGGLGKTTLAKSVYDMVQGRFDCRAFVSLSRNPDLKKVLMDILRQIDKQKCTSLNGAPLDVKHLTDTIQRLLANKRYLIVIDDIWDAPSWEIIKCSFIDSKRGSRVITTTRVFNVAKREGGIYKLKALSCRDSKELFSKRLLCDKEEVPSYLQEVYEKLLLQCGGVPLAIITMASWLARKSMNELSKVYHYISFDNGVNSDDIKTKKILLLSYYNLPYHLRACLLHLHIFPMDYLIKKETLIWKWAAEGFIFEEPGTGLFELGERYFKELINRNLVVPVEDESHCGIIVGCRVSSLVFDLICSLSTPENFVTVLDGPPMEIKARRLAVQKKAMEKGDPLLSSRQESVRSFNTTGCHFNTKLSLSRFKLLRVIAIEECTFIEGERHNLKYLGRLPQLRYLGLYNTPIEKLPKEIGDLLSLQTLDLRGTRVQELPWRVVRLRQLNCLRSDEGTEVPEWMVNLTSLEELRLGEVGMSVNFVNELGRLKELRELEIWAEQLDESKEKALVHSLSNLYKMQVLRLMGVSSSGDEANWECYKPPGELRELHITNAFSRLPAWIDVSHVPMLSYLHVNVKAVEEQDLENLGSLPELVSLKLQMPSNVFPTIKAGGAFPKLRYFDTSAPIRFLPGAMPCLEFFRFRVDAEAWTAADFDSSKLGNLPLLQKVEVEISSSSDPNSLDAAAVHDSLKRVVDHHPNSPNLITSHKTNQVEITY